MTLPRGSFLRFARIKWGLIGDLPGFCLDFSWDFYRVLGYNIYGVDGSFYEY